MVLAIRIGKQKR